MHRTVQHAQRGTHPQYGMLLPHHPHLLQQRPASGQSPPPTLPPPQGGACGAGVGSAGGCVGAGVGETPPPGGVLPPQQGPLRQVPPQKLIAAGGIWGLGLQPKVRVRMPVHNCKKQMTQQHRPVCAWQPSRPSAAALTRAAAAVGVAALVGVAAHAAADPAQAAVLAGAGAGLGSVCGLWRVSGLGRIGGLGCVGGCRSWGGP